ncbi:MAG: peptidoglycan editing factor PgeF [Bacteroidales bacterium]|nr:peptidoglycan editing factor PgeF [Bacteroidales bacterium]
MIKTTINNLEMLQYDSLKNYCGISHFVTLRNCKDKSDPYDGFNICDYSGDSENHIKSCRKSLCEALNIDQNNLVLPFQVHDNKIGIVSSPSEITDYDQIESKFPSHQLNSDFSKEINSDKKPNRKFDALICNKPGICIGISTADCVPVILYSPKDSAIAAIHAGWRGTVKHIVYKCVIALNKIYGVNSKDIIACIGPSISPQKFETGPEVVIEFINAGYKDFYLKAINPNSGNSQIDIDKETIDFSSKYFIDLWDTNKTDLINAGIDEKNIEISEICTYTNYNELFSARRIGIKSGRIASVIMINKI